MWLVGILLSCECRKTAVVPSRLRKFSHWTESSYCVVSLTVKHLTSIVPKKKKYRYQAHSRSQREGSVVEQRTGTQILGDREFKPSRDEQTNHSPANMHIPWEPPVFPRGKIVALILPPRLEIKLDMVDKFCVVVVVVKLGLCCWQKKEF